MMNLRLVFILLISSISLSGYASRNIEEEVFVKLNASTFLSGETLLYSAFVNSKVTGKPSPLSKILYVELLTDKGKVVQQSKLKVVNGRAFGDIFVSSTLSTGTYRLVAYTRWMKNFDSCFEVAFVIINPFKTVDSATYSTNEWEMTFDAGSNGIVRGLENTVRYNITFPEGRSVPFKGKIVDAEGNKLLGFTNSDRTYGKLFFKPNNLSKHQVIIEDANGQFHFFDLPEIVDSGTLLSQIAFDDFTVFSIHSTEQYDNVRLQVSNKKGYEFVQAVSMGASVKFLHKGLEAGLYIANIIQDDIVLDRMAFYIADDESSELALSQNTFNKRDLVIIDQHLAEGSYAVSVRRVRDGFADYRPSAFSYYQLFSQINSSSSLPIEQFDITGLDEEDLNLLLIGQQLESLSTQDSVLFLPEHRGELISGVVTDESKVPLNDKYVGFSVLGNNQYIGARTDSKGKFVLNNYSVNEDLPAYLMVFDSDNYVIELEKSFTSDHSVSDLPEFQIDSTIIANLVESSIRAQIENAYFDIKKDSSYHAVGVEPIFENLQFSYILDEYNRFRTIKEQIVEFIPELAVRKDKGETIIKVRLGEVFSDSYAPLIMLDGIPILPTDILAFSPFKIRQISGLNRRVYIGSQIFDGLVLFETFEGDLHGFEVSTNYQKHTLKGLESNKIYQFPDYASVILDRIPDQREQLYWEPLLNTTGESLNLQFYTSDVLGDYVIEIDGFTAQGQPVYKKGLITVQ